MHYKSPLICAFQWSLDISLKDDFRDMVYDNLKRAGYKDIDRKNAIYQYYNLRKRQIEQRPRNVLYSKEFICPDEYEVALKEFEEKVKRGENLMPFQSEKIKIGDYNDLLLNDWGIQHFHLSRRYRDDGFVARSQYQIFAYVTDTTVYMIQVYSHNADYLYSKQELVRILRNNWPTLIERFHMAEVVGLTEKIDDRTYGEIRNANISTFVELGENEVYAMIGGGYASNGFSTEALRNADFLMKRLEVFQKITVEKAEWIGRTVNQLMECDAPLNKMKMKLLWMDSADNLTMCEMNSRLVLKIDTKENCLKICSGFSLTQIL